MSRIHATAPMMGLWLSMCRCLSSSRSECCNLSVSLVRTDSCESTNIQSHLLYFIPRPSSFYRSLLNEVLQSTSEKGDGALRELSCSRSPFGST
ncbi:hypothetical protein C8R42DRAFT_688140 [Lentinula raphanica]|nr:hypothetical protein C8R42DRAFT_688140 [Lentinula raphanica]